MATLGSMLKLSKRWIDPNGSEIVDKFISNIPIFMDAFGNNDMTTVHRIIEETQESMDAIKPYITDAHVRKVHAENIDTFKSLVTCINDGKCGFQDLLHYLFGFIYRHKTLFTTLSD